LNLAKRIMNWLLLVVTMIYLATGLGISQFRIVEFVTFELLSKNLAFRIHDSLLIPFLLLLVLHVVLAVTSHRIHAKGIC
jgi:cytochrome b561